jgi:protein-S-isoprenylcysteine O-methyltransferase Ste14
MNDVDLAILVIWLAFWIYWLAASVNTKPSQGASGRLGGLGRFAGMRVGIVLLVLLVLRLGIFHKSGGATDNPWREGVGFAIFVMGLALAIWARLYLGRNWGVPMSRRVEPELVTTGPYRRVRHPIYSGIILAMIGTTVAVSLYWLVAAIVLGAYFAYSASVEERNMEQAFPEAYAKYKRSTKRLIPFIY